MSVAPAAAREMDVGAYPRVAAAFDALDAAGCSWAVLRGVEGLAQPDGDVDLLVSPESPYAASLARAGFVRVRSSGHGGHRFFLCYEPRDDAWLKLDVVTALRFGPWHQLLLPGAARAVLGRRQGRRLRPVDEDALRFLHLAFDKTRSAALPSAAERLRVGPLHSDVLRRVDGVCGRGAAAELVRICAAGNPERTAQLVRVLQQRWAREQRLRAAARVAMARTGARLAPAPSVGRGNGAAVVLLGPDGAGKTTLASALAGALPVPTGTVYLGLWRTSRWDERLTGVPFGRLSLKLGRGLTGAVRARLLAMRGRVAVLDRSAHDGLVVDADRSLGGRVATTWVLRAEPRPVSVLLLDAPAATLWGRKREQTVEALAAQRRGYLSLLPQLPGGVVLDASAHPEQVRRAALDVIWAALAARGCRG